MSKNKIIVLLIFGLFMLTGCTILDLSAEEKEMAKKNEETGKEMALSYISNKYGITPDVKKSVAETQRNSFGPLYLTGDVYVTMEYEGKTFYVKVPISNKFETEISDTYQNEIIKVAIIKEIESIFNSKVVFFDSYLTGGNKSGGGIVYYHDYYDGTNLTNFITGFMAGVVNASPLDVEGEEQLYKTFYKKNNADITIYNYKSEEAFKKASTVKKERSTSSYETSEAIYLKEKYYIDPFRSKTIHYNINITKSDIIVGNESTKENKIYSINNYDKKELSSDELNYIYQNYRKKPKIVLNSINIKNEDVSFVYISSSYYKKNKVSSAMFYCKTTKTSGSSASEFNQVGDYYYSRLNSINNCEDAYIILGQ